MNVSVNLAASDTINSQQLEELQFINLQLASLGQPICDIKTEQTYLKIAENLLKNKNNII